MKALTENACLNRFFGGLAQSTSRLLLLDYDGTLAPFREKRNEARPYPGVLQHLSAISAGGRTRLVLISGRATSDLIPLLSGLDPLPELWGAHGWERRYPDGRTEGRPLPADASAGLARARKWAAGRNLGARCEVKPASVAVHMRGMAAEEMARFEREVKAAWTPLAAAHSLDLASFDGGIELRARGTDKGTAVATLVHEAPRGATIAYGGDDLTDEDAFRALDGSGLRILVRPEYRETAADIWLQPPEELLEFLQQWRRATGEQS